MAPNKIIIDTDPVSLPVDMGPCLSNNPFVTPHYTEELASLPSFLPPFLRQKKRVKTGYTNGDVG